MTIFRDTHQLFSWMYGMLVTIFLLSITLPHAVMGQQKRANQEAEKGITPTVPVGKTYAVVVGVSDYSNNKISDLQFAHRDAESFEQYLRSSMGGDLKGSDQVSVFLNSQAKLADVSQALYKLTQTCKAGDRVILFFAVHGDVDAEDNEAYLLLHDAAYEPYWGSGVLSLDNLNRKIINVLLRQKVRVTAILDACHAGKLSGNSINGTRLIGYKLNDAISNTAVKLLSCEPDQTSLEGESWGGGHGVFTYYLINGLWGEADGNNDERINLREIRNYLEEQVSRAVAPHKQIPKADGGLEEVIVNTDSASKKAITRFWQLPDTQPPVNQVLHAQPSGLRSGQDSLFQKTNQDFQAALANKRFFEPEKDCAEWYYGQLIRLELSDSLREEVKATYAVALQNEAQANINATINTVDSVISKGTTVLLAQYKPVIRQLDRAVQLLPARHPLFSQVQSKKLLFEGIFLFNNNISKYGRATAKPILEAFNKALRADPKSPITHYYIAHTYASMLWKEKGGIDSAILHVRLANRYAQTWALPYAHIGFLLSHYAGQAKSDRQHETLLRHADELLTKAEQLDSGRVTTWLGRGAYYFYQGEYLVDQLAVRKTPLSQDEQATTDRKMEELYARAAAAYRKCIALDSTHVLAWGNLAGCYMDTTQANLRVAESILDQAYRINPNYSRICYLQGAVYGQQRRYDRAEAKYREALKINAKLKQAMDSLGMLYIYQGRYPEAITAWHHRLGETPDEPNALYQLARAHAQTGAPDSALHYLKTSLALEKPTLEDLEEDPLLEPLRPLPAYAALIRKVYGKLYHYRPKK